MVVLDPGHGGVDPGTSSAAGITEKEVVLTFARTLKAKLDATGRYEVYLTRDDDTFLPLRERVEFAQKKGAGLFLSIHADYFPNKIDKATGATVYTLSEEASDEEARALAAKENFSDALAGVELPSDSDEVLANILIDLAQRETQNRSAVFARSIVGELASKGDAAYQEAEIGGISGVEGAGRPLGPARAWILEQSRRREAPHLRGLARADGRGGGGIDRHLFRQARRPQPVLTSSIARRPRSK